MRRQRLRAFSLIEVLVVIAITAILIGLLLSAIQRTRDAGARINCANNLRQIGLACTQYHNANDTFPAGVSIEEGTSPYPYMSWEARILPFIEEDALWNLTEQAYLQTPNFSSNPPHVGVSTVLRIYACPADPRTSQAQIFRGVPVALSSYLGVLGTQTFAEDGVLFKDSHVRLADITDGASNTLLVGERPASADMRYGWWYAGRGMYSAGTGDLVLGVRESNWYGPPCPPGPYHFTAGQFSNQCDMFHFWSPHNNGSHFLFVDGSVHFLGYASDDILPALATRAGRESVTLP